MEAARDLRVAFNPIQRKTVTTIVTLYKFYTQN